MVFLFQVHCAAASGNVQVLKWLTEEHFCGVTDVVTGEPLLNGLGQTVLAVAARKGDVAMMRYAVHTLRCSVSDVTDLGVLQRGLHAALEVDHVLFPHNSALGTHAYHSVQCCCSGARAIAIHVSTKTSARFVSELQFPEIREDAGHRRAPDQH